MKKKYQKPTSTVIKLRQSPVLLFSSRDRLDDRLDYVEEEENPFVTQ